MSILSQTELQKLNRPTDGKWLLLCRHPDNLVVHSIQPGSRVGTESAFWYPPVEIAVINTEKNPNSETDARVIQATRDLYWACVNMLRLIDSIENKEILETYEQAIKMMRDAVKLAQEGYPPSVYGKMVKEFLSPKRMSKYCAYPQQDLAY